MKKLLIIGALLTWLAFGPIQDSLQDGHNPLINLADTLHDTTQRYVDQHCAAKWDSTVDPDCGIELRSPAELTATAGRD